MRCKPRLFSASCLALPVLLASLPAMSETVSEENNPECRFCPDTQGIEARYEFGIGNLTDDDPDFADAWGFEDEGYFVIGNASLHHRNADTGFVDMELRDIGLGATYLGIEGGEQGHYTLKFEYDEISHRSHDGARTAYTGSSYLALPGNWVDADATQNMPVLGSSLSDIEIGHQRERITLGGSWIPAKRLQWDVQVRQERKQGTGTLGGSFITQASILPSRIDYVTDEIESTLGYSGKYWHAQLGYYGSLFRNGDRATTWDNPYSPLTPGADIGRSAQPPDNQFHQLSFAYNYRPSSLYSVSSMLAIGRMSQDEDFIPATTNPNLAVTLPRNSLDGKVDTTTGNIKAFFKPWSKLGFTGEFLYNDRDNNTPRENWQQVVTDVFTGSIRRNIPYTYNQQAYRLSADWKPSYKNRLSAGIERDVRKRRGQAVERTDEDTSWLKWRFRPMPEAELLLKLSGSRRDGSQFQTLNSIVPPENPRMRQYHLADRDRSQANLQLNVFALNDMQLGFGLSYADDDYRNSPIGLQNGKQVDMSGNASFKPREHWHSHVFLTHSRIDSNTNNSQSFGAADWRAINKDRITTFGTGTTRSDIFGKFDLELEYSQTRATGDVSVVTGAANPAFPALTSKMHVFRSTTTYHWRPQLALHFGYWFELFRTKDWALDDVTVTTLPSVLHLDQREPSYKVHVFMLSTEYTFQGS